MKFLTVDFDPLEVTGAVEDLDDEYLQNSGEDVTIGTHFKILGGDVNEQYKVRIKREIWNGHAFEWESVSDTTAGPFNCYKNVNVKIPVDERIEDSALTSKMKITIIVTKPNGTTIDSRGFLIHP